MTPLQSTAKTVGTAESNISEWSEEETQIVEAAAVKVTGQLIKKSKARAWFPRAERELYNLYLATRKRGLKVSTLRLCTIMAGLIEKHYPGIPEGKRSRRAGAGLRSGRTRTTLSSAGGTTRRTRALKSASKKLAVSTRISGR